MLEPFTMQLAGVRGFEWIILGAIILALFFGVKKIPEFAKSFGRASGEFEKAKIEMGKELERAKKTDTEERRKLESVADTLGIHYTGKTDDELRQAITKDIKKDRVDL
jgi:sec-independent protein translocase protein TatA